MMKPIEKKTYTAQALLGGKGVTWMDDCEFLTEMRLPSMGNRHNHSHGDGYGSSPSGKLKVVFNRPSKTVEAGHGETSP